jgi:hypothetical protein
MKVVYSKFVSVAILIFSNCRMGLSVIAIIGLLGLGKVLAVGLVLCVVYQNCSLRNLAGKIAIMLPYACYCSECLRCFDCKIANAFHLS